ncbi:MAG: hypothetical protein KGI36_10330 [Burkholderiales bacterium]|nr:hypothetical protein [Burkholderiales bacterium]
MSQAPFLRAALCCALATPLALAPAASAQAMSVHGAAPPPARGAHAPPPAKPLRPGALTLVAGRIDAVDHARHTITVAGKVLALPAPGRIFRSGGGGQASPAALVPGTAVRFALAPGNATPRRLAAIYIGRAR